MELRTSKAAVLSRVSKIFSARVHHMCQLQPTRDQPHSDVGDLGNKRSSVLDKQPAWSEPHSKSVTMASSKHLFFNLCALTSSTTMSATDSASSDCRPTCNINRRTKDCWSAGIAIADQTSIQSRCFLATPGRINLVMNPCTTSSSSEPSGLTAFVSPSSPRIAYRSSCSFSPPSSGEREEFEAPATSSVHNSQDSSTSMLVGDGGLDLRTGIFATGDFATALSCFKALAPPAFKTTGLAMSDEGAGDAGRDLEARAIKIGTTLASRSITSGGSHP
mmetsp:Transcript_48414/g.128210  ORF Transcript_48414/g.128210 Transcript_48414/m.128210 type:complete len:276 (-) Transcript_48414:176-1003(-)